MVGWGASARATGRNKPDVMSESERLSVVIQAGFGIHGQNIVVSVDRLEDVAFHSEPGERNYWWMF